MDDFYQELICNIKKNMEENRWEEAMRLLEEEFSMPYIPKQEEEVLIDLYNECRSWLNQHRKVRSYTEEDIEDCLFGNLEEALQAVELLRKSNIRNHLDVVERYLKNHPHYLIRTLLLECLIEQQVNDEIMLDFDGMEVSFTPCYIELPQDQDVFREAVTIVDSYFANENPSFLTMCVECMMKEMYFRLPFALGEDEIYHFIYAILYYVYKANEDLEGFQMFISEKNLANYKGYDLLLYKYDV